jgi:hypothetical protein
MVLAIFLVVALVVVLIARGVLAQSGERSPEPGSMSEQWLAEQRATRRG